MSDPEGDPSRSLFGHAPFALFWFSRVLSTVAFQIQAVAVGWTIYALTDSAFALGLVGLAQFLPMVALTLVVGQVADRYDRRRVIAICQTVEATAAIAFTLGTLGGWLGRDAILALLVVVGAARAFEGPTLAALVPGLVSRAELQRATAWSASANQTAQIVGPAIGGLLYAVGPTAAFATAATMFLAAAVCASLIRMVAPARPRERVTLASIFSGIVFIRSRPVLLGVISLDLFAVLLGGATALLPIYARDILGTGPWGLGLLRAAPAVGALAMSVVLGRNPMEHRVGPTLFVAVITFGLATMLFGISTDLRLSLAALALLGASDVVSVVIRFALVQLQTPDEMRGRVSAVNYLFVGTSNQLGEFESGLTAALFGAVPAVLLGGFGTVLVALLWMRIFPQLRRIHSLEG
ncbi:MAG TPA: MFS transporter [Stellaceae bacterium]|nr:MFS transporter [Stellaceae bacterium]